MATQSTALADAISQITPGGSQGYPDGLSWDTGLYGTTTLKPAPAGFSALTGWGVVYPEAGQPVSPNASSDTVQIEGFTTYVHLTNGSWVQVQNQAQTGVSGLHYVADFSSSYTSSLNEQTLPDGSVSVDAPQVGYNDHFWPTQRGTFTPGTVDGVFVEANMKTNDPSANLVAQLGADWWLNSTAQYVSGFANNPVVGGGNFIKLSTQWQPVYYSSLSPQQLSADPPPPLQASAPSTPPTTVSTPSAPTLTVAEHTLSVSPGGSVSLGIGVSIPKAGDNVSVEITGLPKYETITDKLDSHKFTGSTIWLSAAEANSGLTLSSNYRGQGHPTTTLTITAEDNTAPATTSPAQTITVTDPPTTTSNSGTPHHHQQAAPATHHPVHHHPNFGPTNQTLAESGASNPGWTPTVTSQGDALASASASRFALLQQVLAASPSTESQLSHLSSALSGSPQQFQQFLAKALQ
jgi:hypothetical protein